MLRSGTSRIACFHALLVQYGAEIRQFSGAGKTLIPVTIGLFYLGPLLYIAASIAVVRYVLRNGSAWLTVAQRLLAAGMASETAVLLLRWMQWGRLPLTSISDVLNLFTLLAASIVLITARSERTRILLALYAPAIAGLAIIKLAPGHAFVYEPPKELSTFLLGVHVGLAILAYALFLVASLTGLAYVLQVRHLKNRREGALFRRLPSLERLDTTLYRLIGVGYPLFAVTMIQGLYWAWAERELLGAMWYLSPKIILSVVMVLFYAISFHARQVGRLRGRRLAYFVVIGFGVLLGGYIVLEILGLRDLNFWGTAA